MRTAILDTGPVIGLLLQTDGHRESAIAALRASAAAGRRLATTWEVIGEAYTYFRAKVARAKGAGPALTVLRWARESGVVITPSREEDHQRAHELLRSYEDVRLSYVDALLLAIAERSRAEEVITVDGGHFRAVSLTPHPLVTVV
jgi:predicted nucleic acid-binding protein